jgi:uncharacterized surface protein with fasciclin (FAS1) repeats
VAKIRYLRVIAAVFGVVAFAAVGSLSASAAPSVSAATIPDVAAANDNFKTLTSLLKASGLDKELSGSGPFTIFAPTDAAFAKLPKAMLDALAADPDALRAMLLYHVVAAKVTLTTAKTMSAATTLDEAKVGLSLVGESVYVNNAKVVTPDIAADNGVIQGIDTVLMPLAARKLSTSSAGYCAVAGNTWPTGKPIPAGSFLSLNRGQPTWDYHYVGAVPAFFIEGMGITCDPPAAGYVQKGRAPGSLHVPSNLYPYFVKG